jgi:hypothetical protein
MNTLFYKFIHFLNSHYCCRMPPFHRKRLYCKDSTSVRSDQWADQDPYSQSFLPPAICIVVVSQTLTKKEVWHSTKEHNPWTTYNGDTETYSCHKCTQTMYACIYIYSWIFVKLIYNTCKCWYNYILHTNIDTNVYIYKTIKLFKLHGSSTYFLSSVPISEISLFFPTVSETSNFDSKRDGNINSLSAIKINL